MLQKTGAIRFLLALVLFAFAQVSFAQTAYPTVFPKSILLLDQERLFAETDLGKAILQKVIDQRVTLITENRAIDLSFETEELRLTEQRATLSGEEFQKLAEDFDLRVQAAREAQLQKGRELQAEFDRAPAEFMALAAPHLTSLMQKYQASALLDRRSVLLFDQKMDITVEAIRLLNAAMAENPNTAVETEK